MRRYCGILIVLCLLIMIPQVSSLRADQLEWTITDQYEDDGWLIAGETETASIQIYVPGATISSAAFSVEGNLGSFDTADIENGPPSYIFSTFHPGTKSGNSTIELQVTYIENSKTYTQNFTSPAEKLIKIDHNNADTISSIIFEKKLTVNTTTNIVLQMKDQYGNIVDNKYETDEGKEGEAILFVCSPNSASFLDEYENDIGQEVTIAVDSTGNVIVPFRLSTKAGENIIYFDPEPRLVESRWITIYGTAESEPTNIDLEVIPASLKLPADGLSKFDFICTLSDRFHNPIENTGVKFETSLDQTAFLKTGNLGAVALQWGAYTKIGPQTVTFTSTENSSLVRETTVEFVLGDEMQLVAYPVTMPSRDANPSVYSTVEVHLLGIEAIGEDVEFKIENIQNDTNQVEPPYFTGEGLKNCNAENTTCTVATNQFGIATIHFIPGEFKEGAYTNASCILTATWGEITQKKVLKWSNEGIISVYTSVTPRKAPSECYAPGDIINVTIELRGDGIPSDFIPVDVILAMNRGDSTFGDMFKDMNKLEFEDKIVYAIDAALEFLRELGDGANHLGLVTYGPPGTTVYTSNFPGNDDNAIDDDEEYILEHYPAWDRNYPDMATLDQALTNITEDIRDSVELTTPSESPDYSGDNLNSMRYALYKSIMELTGPNSTSSIKAIILFTDREWDYYGHPLGGAIWDDEEKEWVNELRGKACKDIKCSQSSTSPDFWPFDNPSLGLTSESSRQQNMAILAQENNIIVYVVGYSDGATSINKPILGNYEIDNQQGIYALVNSTGGKFYVAATQEDLIKKLVEIAGELRFIAGSNVTLNADLVSPLEGQESLNITADKIFKYVHSGNKPGVGVPLTDESTIVQYWCWNTTCGGSPAVYSGNCTEERSGTPWKNDFFNDSDSWNDYNIEFDIGTINMKETWKTQFRLEINASLDKPYIFNLFGNNSYISYEGEDVNIKIPELPLCENPNSTTMKYLNGTINVTNLNYTIYNDKIHFNWDLSYTGNHDTFLEIIEIADMFGDNLFRGVREVKNSTVADNYTWILADTPVETYNFTVTAVTKDAGTDNETEQINLSLNNAYILVE